MSSLSAPRYGLWGALIALVTFIADQGSKAAILYGLGLVHCAPCPAAVEQCRACTPIEILPFFDLVMVWNRGVSYGLFPADSPAELWLLIGFSFVMSGILAWWLARAETRLLALGLGLIIGGAIGNVIDRLFFGAVADFFHFHAFSYSWYVFNIADAAIVIGVAVILIDAFFPGRAAPSGAAPNA